MQSQINAVHMVILLQPDLDKAIAFYEELGLKKIFHIKDKWAEFQIGNVKLGLCPTGQSQEGNRTGIVLAVDDLRKAHSELKEKVTFLGEPKEAVHGIMVSFVDPAGNILDLYQPTPEKVADMVKQTAQSDEEASDDSAAEGSSVSATQSKRLRCAKASECCQA